MRYHTAPLIAFTAYLEMKRRELGPNSPMFESGRQFKCYVKDMKIEKTSTIEHKIAYRRYALSFTYGGYGGNSYTFRLDPQHSFFNHVVEGMAEIGSKYNIRRSSYYKENYVQFDLGYPSGGISSGSYVNWHGESGKYSGNVSYAGSGTEKYVTLSVEGSHYRRDKSSPYYNLSANQRITHWDFTIPLTQIEFPRLG